MQRSAATIPEVLATGAACAAEYSFHLDDGRVALSFAEVVERAERGARQLTALGVEPGDAVGVLGPNRPEWVVWAHAIWAAGAAVVPVQVPLRVRNEGAFRERLRTIVEIAGCRRVLADPRLAPFLPDGIGVAWDEPQQESDERPAGPRPDSTAVIQFTSGSTARPKGVLIAHDAMVAQIDLLHDHYYGDGELRRTVSWAPFFHDLGLVTCVVLPPRVRSSVELLPTELFARDPVEWLRVVDRTRGIGTLGPSSAFGAAIRAACRRRESIDLSSLEVAHFAAEGVDPEVAQRMADAGAREFGLDPAALGSTYGLAEAVLGVAYTRMGEGMRVDRIALDELARSGVAVPAGDGPTRLVASCGTPVMDLRIVGSGGKVLPERRVGEIRLRGPSLMSGYVGADALDPFDDGWLCTGDLGYLADGELYVTGRAKDVVIVTGQNYYPEDFEWAAARVEGVRPGRCAAFARPEVEEVVLLVEAADERADRVALARAVKRGVVDAVGVAPSEVAVVPRGTIQKTTSGKLQRAAMRAAYRDGGVDGVAAVAGR